MKHDQYDASNLKGILNNCTVFRDWVRHKPANKSTAADNYFDPGWLQKFQDVAKMRNDDIGHCNSQRLRIGLNIIYCRLGFSEFFILDALVKLLYTSRSLMYPVPYVPKKFFKT